MEYIVIVLAFVLCSLIAYYIMKLKVTVFIKGIINFLGLLVFGIFMIVSGLNETTLLIYILLLAMTVFGMLMRIISPVVLNLAVCFVAKITKQEYEWLTYDQLMELEHSGNKMYFCVLAFTTLKVAFYLMFVASCVGLI